MLTYLDKIKTIIESSKMKELLNLIPVNNLSKEQLRTALEPHQQYAVARLYNSKRLILGDEMRLGKSVVLIAICKIIQAKNPQAKFIFIMPDYLKYNFYNEILKWYPNEKALIIDKAKDMLKIKDNNFIIINYDKFRLKTFDINLNIYEVVVLDESHRFKIRQLTNTYMRSGKNVTSLQMLNLYEKLEKYKNYLYFMSGSPMAKSFGDLYGPLKLLAKHKWEYGAYSTFCSRFCNSYTTHFRGSPYPISFWVGFKEEESKTIGNLLTEYMLRRTHKEIYPDKLDAIHHTIYSHITWKKEYKEKISLELNNLLYVISSEKFINDYGAALSITDISKLYYLHFFEKQKEILHIIEDVKSSGGKIIVVNPYIIPMESLESLYKISHTSAGLITANIPTHLRQPIIDKFKEEDAQVLFATAGSIAEGLDLSFCDTIIITQPILNIIIAQQIIKRLDNIKRIIPYKVIYHVYKNSFEYILYRAFHKRLNIIKQVINSDIQNEEYGTFIVQELQKLIKND